MAANKCPLETVEQTLFFNYLASDLPFIDSYAFAVPNGAHKSPAAAAKFKGEGLKPGVPDVFIAIPKDGYHGLFIEFKRQKGSYTSPNQKEWIGRLQKIGYKVVVAKGYEHAKELLADYLSRKDDGTR